MQREFFDADSALQWAERYLPNGVAVEIKIPGERVQVHKVSGQIYIYSASGIDRAERLPDVVKELDSIPDGVILDAELLVLFKGEPVAQPDMNTFLRSKEPPDPEQWAPLLFLFDALYHDGKDLHLEPWVIRQEALQEIWPEDTQHVKRVRPIVVTDAQAFKEAVRKARGHRYSEGAMLKDVMSQYQLGRRTVKWAKIKDTASLFVRVTKREVRTGGDPWTHYFYEIELADGTPVGQTYATSEKAAKGDTIEIKITGIERRKDKWLIYDPIVVRKVDRPPDGPDRLERLMRMGLKPDRLTAGEKERLEVEEKKEIVESLEFLAQLTVEDAPALSPEDLERLPKPKSPRQSLKVLLEVLYRLGLLGDLRVRDVLDNDPVIKLRLDEMVPHKLKNVPDQELLQAHHRLHQLAGAGNVSWETLVNLHVFVQREMERRGMQHNVHDKLDRDSEKWSGEEVKAESLADIDFTEMDDVVLIPDFISIVGSAVERPDPNDIDVLIRAEEVPPSWLVRLEEELGAAGVEEYHRVFNPEGPHDDYIPLYHLALMRAPFQVRHVEFAKRAKSLRPMVQNFKPLKTAGGYGTLEFADEEAAWETWAQGFEQGVAVETKYDGFRVIIHKKGDKVKVFSEDAGRDLSSKLGSTLDDIKSLPGDLILDGELMLYADEPVEIDGRKYRKGQKIERMDMPSFLSKNPPGRYKAKIAVFDALYVNEDLHQKPWNERQKALSKVLPRNKGGLIRVRPIIAKTKREFIRAVKMKRREPNSEGAMLKVVDSPYPLTGATRQVAKVKNFKEIRVRIKERERKKNGWVYVGELSDGTVIGRTYVTDIEAKPGDILEVRVAEVKVSGDKITWDNPIPVSVKPKGTAVTTPEQARALARARRTYVAKSPDLVLTLVGTGALKSPRKSASLFVEHDGSKVLIDAGPDIKKEDLPAKPDVILITDEESWFAKDAKRLAEELGVEVVQDEYVSDGLRITPFPVEHTNHPVFGYRIEADGYKVIYAPEFWKFPARQAKGADVAILEGSAWDRPIRFAGGVGGHAAILDTLNRAKAVGVKRIIFTHIGKPVEEAKDKWEEEGVEIGEDGQKIRLIKKAEALAGIYLVKPHGQMAISGEKRLIVKSRPFLKYVGEPLALIEDKRILGVIELGAPFAIDLKTFDELRDLHKITEEERKKWWPDAEVLYAYPFEVLEVFDPPRPYDTPKGAQTFLTSVVLKSMDDACYFCGGPYELFVGEVGICEDCFLDWRGDDDIEARLAFDEEEAMRAVPVFVHKADPGEEGGETRSEAAKRFWEENWNKLLPKSGRGKFVFHLHWRGLSEDEIDKTHEELLRTNHSVHGDLRLEGNQGLWGFTVFEGRTADIRRAGGERLSAIKPNDALQGTFKLMQPKAWLKVGVRKPFVSEPSEVGATSRKYAKFFVYDRGTYDLGVARAHSFEIFLRGKKLNGRYVIRYARFGNRRAWTITKPKEQRPLADRVKKEDLIKELKRKGQKWLVWAKPGQKPEFIDVQKVKLEKAIQLPIDWDRMYEIIEKRDWDRYTLGVVYAPGEVDKQGQFANARTIEKACWAFGAGSLVAGEEHWRMGPGTVVENYIARVPMVINGQEVPEGSWLLGVIWEPDVFAKILAGDITGYSLGGFADLRPGGGNNGRGDGESTEQ